MSRIGIFGAGGFGREVMSLLSDSTEVGGLCYVSDHPTESDIRGIPHISTNDFLQTSGNSFAIAVAKSSARAVIDARLSPNAHPTSITAPNAFIGSNVAIGEGAIICPFSCLTADSRIGRHFHCNIYSYVAHDCLIGDFVTFAPRVSCNGNVIIEDHAYIGTGAIIINGTPGKPITIGRGAVVGMGAVVTKDVPAGSTVIGIPAKEVQGRQIA